MPTSCTNIMQEHTSQYHAVNSNTYISYFIFHFPTKQHTAYLCHYTVHIGVGTVGECAPPSFHKLLYKLLTTLCVVSNCAPPPPPLPPIKKSFLCHWYMLKSICIHVLCPTKQLSEYIEVNTAAKLCTRMCKNNKQTSQKFYLQNVCISSI